MTKQKAVSDYSTSEETVLTHKHFRMGKAPYGYVGLWCAPSRELLEKNPEAYNRQMRSAPKCCHFSCDHCGMGINNHCIIKDANGDKFSIGTTCLEKLDRVENVTKAKLDQREHSRKLRAARKERKIEADLEAQRERNGGLTDSEVYIWERQQEREANAALEKELEEVCFREASYFIEALLSSGNFGKDLARSMTRGRIPGGRGEPIMLDMVAKFHSGALRKGSRSYNEAYQVADQKLQELKQTWEA